MWIIRIVENFSVYEICMYLDHLKKILVTWATDDHRGGQRVNFKEEFYDKITREFFSLSMIEDS